MSKRRNVEAAAKWDAARRVNPRSAKRRVHADLQYLVDTGRLDNPGSFEDMTHSAVEAAKWSMKAKAALVADGNWWALADSRLGMFEAAGAQ